MTPSIDSARHKIMKFQIFFKLGLVILLIFLPGTMASIVPPNYNLACDLKITGMQTNQTLNYSTYEASLILCASCPTYSEPDKNECYASPEYKKAYVTIILFPFFLKKVS